MTRSLMILLAGIAIGAGGYAAAHNEEKSSSVKVIDSRDIVEKLDGKETKETVVELTLKPGEAGSPHRHPGPVFGYILEGTYELGIDDQPTRIYSVGETFYEPTGCLHRVSKNPAGKGKTRVLAVLLHPRDVKDLAIPEKEPK